MPERWSWMWLANALMLILFVSWAGLQYNDPDALVWIGVYGAAAIECLLFFLGRFPRPLGAAYMVLCLLWSAVLGVRVAAAGEFFFDEQGREMMGLLICAGWTYALYVKSQQGVSLEPVRHL